MSPEILIVGDRALRGELIPRVQDLGYVVVPVRERDLLRRVGQSPAPGAVIVCLGGAETGASVKAAREGRETVPVLVTGRLALADALELGADRFLEVPVDPVELERALAEVVGPAMVDPHPQARSPAQASPEGDPALTQIHQTLEVLAAKLATTGEAGEGDGIDLDALGLDAVPDVDAEAARADASRTWRKVDPARELDPPTVNLSTGRRWAPSPDSAPARQGSAERTAPVETAARPDVEEARRATREPPREATMRLAPARAPTPKGAAMDAPRGSETEPGESTQRVVETGSQGRVHEDASSGRWERAAGRRSPEPEDRRAGGLDRGRERRAEELARTPREAAKPIVRTERGVEERRERTVEIEARGGTRQEGRGEVRGRSGAVVPSREGEVRRGRTVEIEARGGARREGRGEVGGRSGGVIASREGEVRRGSGRPVELGEVRGPRSELGAGEAAEVLARLRRERFTGCSRVVASGRPERRLWWSEGQVIGGESDAASETVLGRLRARGLLDERDLEVVARWGGGDPRRELERLAQGRFIKPREVQEALREPVRRIVEAIVEAGEVRYELYPESRAAAEVELGVPLAALIAGGVRRGMTAERLRTLVVDERRPRLGVLHGPPDLNFAAPEALAAELRWPALVGIAERFDGVTSVGRLVAEAIADEVEIRAAAFVLGLLGHLAPELADEAEGLVALDRRRVRERLRLARESDYFAVLGLDRGATRAEVLRAYADLSATFSDGLEPASQEALGAELEELRAALVEARDVLSDPALHSAYLARRGGS